MSFVCMYTVCVEEQLFFVHCELQIESRRATELQEHYKFESCARG